VSAYVKIDCDIKDQETLIETLDLMGYAREDLILGRRQLRGYQDDLRPERADVSLPGRLGSMSNDVGFEKRADGTWSMHLSAHDKVSGFSRKHEGGFKKAFDRTHAEVAVKKRLKKQGYKWTEKVVEGRKVITATRWKK